MTDDHDLIGAYAVDALEPGERAAFERHLAGCGACRDELVELRETLADLATGSAVEPPAGLRARVLESIGQPAATVTPLPARRAAASGRSRWQLLVAAAVAVIAVIGIAVWQPWAPRVLTAADVLSAPDAVRASETAVGGGTVTLVRSNRLGRAVLVTEALPDPPSGRVRQAWLKRPDGAFVSGGLLPGGMSLTQLLEGDARDAVGGGVSLEPPGGSAQPTIKDVIVLIGL